MENIDQPRQSKGFIHKLRSLQFRTTRRALNAWINPTILGCTQNYLDIKEGDIVCYVMPYRSTADLLVIDKACEENNLAMPTGAMSELENRSFFFLGHPEGRMGRKTQRQYSARMLRLFEHQLSLEKPIKIVPVSIFWGHQPDREKSIFKLILSENWTATSSFKKLLAAFFHPQHILVQFSKPVNLDALIESESDSEKQRRKLHRLLRVHFNRKKQAILGPDLSHRRTLINSIMTSAPVRESIANQAISEEKPPHQIEKRAFAYANEVASHQSYRVIRLFHAILTWLWNKLYEGIEVSQIDTPKELAESHEIVYIPCHRSHIDYLLLSYVLYLNGLTPPHIAAGKNLNLPLLAPLLRRCGAFFMRRSFQGDTLYRAVFDEYMHLMFVRGYSVEYFIEGGRSRTGRTLAPRTGMLSMTVRSFQRDSSKPIVFLPVYFGYERILEASTYIGELTGLSKKDESLLDLFGIFRTFKHTFGKVSVSFGEPVDLSRFLDQELPGWQSHLENPADFSKACTSLSIQLASNINDAATVNPINLVATALLCTPRQTMGLHRLENQVSVLQSLAQTGGKRNTSTTTSLSPTEVIIQAEKVTGIKRNQEGFGDILYAPPESAVLLTYYRNNTQHLFVLTSLIARMLRINATLSGSDIIDRCMVLAPYLRAELFLGWTLDRLPEKCNETLNAMASLGLIKLDNEVVSIPPRTTEEYAALLELGEIVEPILERFHIVTSLLSEDQQQSVENLEKSASDIAHQLSAIYGINSPEFFDRSLFARFISTLKSEGCIGAIKEDESTNDNFFHLKNTIEANLDADVLYNVLQSVTQVTKLSAITDSEKHQNDSLLQTN